MLKTLGDNSGRILGALLAVIALNGCASGAVSQVVSAGSTATTGHSEVLDNLPQSHYSSGNARPEASTDKLAARMRSEAGIPKELFYVSDFASNRVSVYRYPGLSRKVAVLKGFRGPAGQCVDAIGDVWIANYKGKSLVEYAHGGTMPLRTLSTDGTAIGCSISPLNGDVAVANHIVSLGGSDIQVFPNGSQTPTSYSNSNCASLQSPGYDNMGNLYVEGEGNHGSVVCELPAGGTSLQPVSVNESIQSPGSVMWDGQYITLADNGYAGGTAIYQSTEDASGGLTVVGVTPLMACQLHVSVLQPFIVGELNTPVNNTQGTAVIGAAAGACLQQATYLLLWHYPYGNAPEHMYAKNTPREPHGDSVSIAP